MQETAPASPKQISIPLRYAQMLILGVCMLTIGLIGGYLVGTKNLTQYIPGIANANIDRATPEEKDVDFSLFWEVWDTLENSYFDKSKLDPSSMVNGAIKGMVASVGDPYTVFLTPSENKVTQEDLKGNFDGIGIQIGYRGTQLSVIAPLPKSPAEEVGVMAGDYILGIKDESKNIEVGTGGMTLPEAVQIIRGESGTEVKLTLLRDGTDEPFEKVIVRKTIEVPSVTLEFVGENENIAHLKVLKFGAETKNEWNSAVSDILANKGIDGVVLDLRNNPGGYMQAAVELGAEFMNKGKVIVIEERANGSKKEFPTDRNGRLTNQEVVVLVNGGSASASEILAGALRDQVGLKIIGVKTFGKGTIQEPIQLPGGEGLHVTIARWLTPSEYWVHEQGILPDVEIANDPETEIDEQLNAAIGELLK